MKPEFEKAAEALHGEADVSFLSFPSPFSLKESLTGGIIMTLPYKPCCSSPGPWRPAVPLCAQVEHLRQMGS